VKPALLFLVHRIPYPPNKGDKIRSYHLLRYLSGNYRVFLAAFIDDPNDWQYTDTVKQWCEATHFVKLTPLQAKLRGLKGLVTGEALTIPYYQDSAMAGWVRNRIANERIEHILVYSSSMAQYVLDPEYEKIRRVIDFVDVDSDKWRQYAEKKTWPLNWIYSREAKRLLGYEKEIADSFHTSLFVSRQEAEHFKSLAPESATKIEYYRNGVDVDSFDPANTLSSPYEATEQQTLVFTGAMDYWPNEDAVAWFVEQVFPVIKQKWPHARFYIVGSKPSEKVSMLAQNQDVFVTGRVTDVRPYLQHATAVVAPMRIARGIQNKVLEAMAMAKPVVVTSMGLEGIDAEDGTEVLIADDVPSYVDKLSMVFSGEKPDLGVNARTKVCGDFSWEKSLFKLDKWLEISSDRDEVME
jgi:sugar transferase (PEP-CTERM/EpsH1 system associated)